MNLFWASGLAGVIYALYHFFGPSAMILLIVIIPIAIVVLVAMNCAANEMNEERN
jgi:ABC-type transport system involved in cytochrome bd biosynthesis fused ATPase/permease subunit